jgi:hypothetical protein
MYDPGAGVVAGGGAVAGAGGLAATGFPYALYIVVAVVAIVVGLLLLRVAAFRRTDRLAEPRPPVAGSG